MNPTATNVGGWDATSMRSWANDTMFYNLPLKWRRIIKPVQVLASQGDQSSKIVTSIDKLFLFSFAELGYGTTEVPYKNEVDSEAENMTFPVYTNATSRIKKTFNGEGTASYYWTRSSYSSSSSNFIFIYNGGTNYNSAANLSYCVAFGFCV
ncbi:MAG: DUF6273 domain-containing protein [Ruminococcus sp.]